MTQHSVAILAAAEVHHVRGLLELLLVLLAADLQQAWGLIRVST
jgi:hypothetical protein